MAPTVLGTPLWFAPGLVKLLSAVAYDFCLNLPEAFTKPGASHKGVPSSVLFLGATRLFTVALIKQLACIISFTSLIVLS